MSRIGIYGGTFNPPHLGHTKAAEFALRELKLDKLLVIPDRVAPHKQIPEGSPSPRQRLRMLELAVEGISGLEVCDLELNREGPSYTCQTVAELKVRNPGAEFVLLMGTDMFLSFHNWKEYRYLLEQTELAVLCRGQKKENVAIADQLSFLRPQGARVTVLQNPVTAISSTDLRRMLVFQCAEPFLDPKVLAYIRENDLYGVNRDYTGLSGKALEKAVIDLLNPNRVAHVLGCRNTAIALAEHWGEDVEAAGRAGMLHDVTKALPGHLQLTLCREYGTMLSEFDTRYPKTLHAPTGALVAERIFGESGKVVEAIRWHTTGRANMSLLEKIIYIADYIEPNRTLPGVDGLRAAALRDMDEAMLMGLEMTMKHLQNLGDAVSPGSAEALAQLRAAKRKEG